MPMLRRLPRRLDRIAARSSRGRLGLNVRLFADEGDRRYLTGLVHQRVLTFLAATLGVMAVLMLGLHGGPNVTHRVTLYAFYRLLPARVRRRSSPCAYWYSCSALAQTDRPQNCGRLRLQEMRSREQEGYAVMGSTAMGSGGSREARPARSSKSSSCPPGLSDLGDDADGERVAPDASEVLAEQVGGSLGVAGGRGADDLDVVAFPVHLPATVTLALSVPVMASRSARASSNAGSASTARRSAVVARRRSMARCACRYHARPAGLR